MRVTICGGYVLGAQEWTAGSYAGAPIQPDVAFEVPCAGPFEVEVFVLGWRCTVTGVADDAPEQRFRIRAHGPTWDSARAFSWVLEKQ